MDELDKKIIEAYDSVINEAKWNVNYLDKNKKRIAKTGTSGSGGGSQITAPNAEKAITIAMKEINNFPNTEKIQLFKDSKDTSKSYGTWNIKNKKWEVSEEVINEERQLDSLFKMYKKAQVWNNGKVLFGGPVTGVFGEGFRIKDGNNEIEVHFFK